MLILYSQILSLLKPYMFIFRKTCTEYFPYVLNPVSFVRWQNFVFTTNARRTPQKLRNIFVSIFPDYFENSRNDCHLTTDFLSCYTL